MENNFKDTIPLHGGAVYEAARRWGVNPADVLDFSASINPLGPPGDVIRLLRSGHLCLQRYPDSAEFIRILACKLGIDADQIVVGNGSTGLIFAAVRALRPKRALILEPAFVEYRRALESVDAEINCYFLEEKRCFLPDFGDLRLAIRTKLFDLVVLNTPHNPSGAVYDINHLGSLATEAEHSGTFLMIDGAYIDYVPQANYLQELSAKSSVLLLRSLTKFYAIPTLRIGYLLCDGSIAARIRKHIESWPVSGIALEAASAAIRDLDYEQKSRRENEVARHQFAVQLSKIPGLTVFPSAANFFLVKFHRFYGSDLAQWLEPHHILIRRCDSFPGLDDHFVRLAVRSQCDNMRLVDLISQWFTVRSAEERGR